MSEIDDYGEYIYHIKQSGQVLKKYKATCRSCGADRGFKPKSKLLKICPPCKRETPEYKTKHQQAIKSVRSSQESRLKTHNQMRQMQALLRSDPNYSINLKIKNNIRSRLSHAVQGRKKWGSAVGDLGCSIAQLKIHLESKFQPDMTWANYGEWHIDHTIPLSLFNLTEADQFKKACHYTNLQPLWARDNIIKSNSI